MDIIAAHQQGLIERLDEEVTALAGRPRDFAQRAVVLHHLYDHSRSGHHWALIEARHNLRIMARLDQLRARVRRWGWLRQGRDQAEQALSLLADALGGEARRRCVAGYRVYRLSATPALRACAEGMLPSSLLAALDACHSARRLPETLAASAIGELAMQSEALVHAAIDDDGQPAAWAAIEACGLGRAARRLLGAEVLAKARTADERRCAARVERRLVADRRLPASFRANPAQHFYALHQALAERRRQQWRQACDREPDAFALAA